MHCGRQEGLLKMMGARHRYASEVDVEFVRRAVRAIGQCAIKIEPAAGRCVDLLLDLISTRVSYVVQEAVVVIKVGPARGFKTAEESSF
jgi:AP-1 complex subunit beta-1